jgi:hypothetical protein
MTVHIGLRNWSVVIVWLLAASTAQAATWQEAMQVELGLGDRDTRVAIRAAALEEMRTRASQKVGMIVESTMVSTGTKLTDEIRTVGVSLVKIDDVKEEVRIQRDGSVRLNVTATVTVDTSELDRRAASMREDSGKIEKVRLLAQENQILRRSLSDVTRMLGQQGTASATADLLQRQAQILDGLSSNVQRVGQTFGQGALIAMAQKDEQDWQAVQLEIDAGVFERILASPVSAKLVRVESGFADVSVLVQVGWNADYLGIYNVLNRYLFGANLDMGGKLIGDHFGFLESLNGIRPDRAYAQRVFKYLAQSRVGLEISVGGVKKYLPMLFISNEFSNGCEHATESRSTWDYGNTMVCISFQSKSAWKIRGMPLNDNVNPLKLVLNKSQASAASEISATWILKRPGDPEIRRTASTY